MNPPPVIILGMHKSGTTLVAEILHRSGIAMVDAESAASYDEGNHFERTSTAKINKQLLDCASQSSLRTYKPLDRDSVSPAIVREAAKLVAQMSGADGTWGFKDPRTCLTYAFWAETMPDHRLVCVYRDAAEVREHYAGRVPLDLSRGYRALRAWYAYNSQMLRAFDRAGPQPRILLSYERLMDDPQEMARLSRFLAIPLADARAASLRRGKASDTLRLRADRFLLKRRTGSDVVALADRLDSRRRETMSNGQLAQ